MNAKFTPGPWIVVETKECNVISSWAIHIGKHNVSFFPYVYKYADIEKTRGGYVRDPEMHANARMIAAAPDLLEALQACIDYGVMTGDEWVSDKARAAIAKALGEQP